MRRRGLGATLNRDQVLAAIAAQERLRGSVPDEVVDVAVAALRAQLDAERPSADITAYRTDLRLFAVWLIGRQVRLLEVQRTHIELYGPLLEERGLTAAKPVS